MTITNGYCTLANIKDRLNPLGVATQATDDAIIESLIEQASRAIDVFCGGRTFYARTAETRYYNVPPDRQLDLDDDLLSVTTLTNGDSTTIAATDYVLVERGRPPYFGIRLKESSTVVWEMDSSGNTEWVISIAGTWGYIDRAGTDARSLRVLEATEEACILIVLDAYHKFSNVNSSNTSIITPSGAVITAEGIPVKARDLISLFRKSGP